MIVDHVHRVGQYYQVGERLAQGLRFLETTELAALEPGRHAVDGDDVYVMMQHYHTKPLAEGRWEAHRAYLDIQFLLAGQERIGYAHVDDLTVVEAYQPDKDSLILQGEGDFLVLSGGTFAIFGPEDAHMPGIAYAESVPVHKAVVKVRL